MRLESAPQMGITEKHLVWDSNTPIDTFVSTLSDFID